VTWLADRSPRERRLLATAALVTGLVVVWQVLVVVRDDLASLRARVAGHERELADVRRLAAAVGHDAAPPSDATGASLLTRLEGTAGAILGRERIASMTPATGVAESPRIALRVVNASLVETVRLLHALEHDALGVAKLELRKHPDDPGRFDATIEVAE
jgi:type II secretion system (T2SS) protein M